MKPENSATLKVIAFGFFLLFLVFIGLATPFFLRQRDILKNWVEVQGTVQNSEVVSVPQKHGTDYDARVLVQYRLGGAINTALISSGYPSRFRSHAQEWVDRFPAGTKVMIAYNPVNPAEVRLNPGYNRYFFAVPLLVAEFGLGFAAIALMFYVIARIGSRDRVAATIQKR
jgi:Protein of unknown function (DUF3592)